MTYAELLARLLPARRFGMVLGLDRMRAVLDRLGAPDRRLGAIVHVGGTNGKGSTVAMIAALAAAAGQRVATYTSPHLSCLRERITIDGAMISEPDLIAAAEQVRDAVGEGPRDAGGEGPRDATRGGVNGPALPGQPPADGKISPLWINLTFFEQITAIAMLAIAEAGVDVTVLEVGLGGRLDATNVVDPAVAVVTGVALDHEAILGDTVAKIAAEKAGIWKPGRPAIIGASGLAEAVPLLAEAARAAGARPRVIDDADVAAVPPVGLPGEHQRRNAAAAIAAIQALGLPVVASALAAVRHPGRFEIVEAPAAPAGVPRIILDGAHNPHGAVALADALRARGEHPVLIAAVSADKDVAAIAAALAPAVRAVVATRYQQDRAMDPARLAAAFAAAPGAPAAVAAAPDLAAALAVAATCQAPIVIAGSLFLVGEARTMLLGAPTDPVRLSDPVATPR